MNDYLVRWLMRKYKHLACHKTRASHALGKLGHATSDAFVHWSLGCIPKLDDGSRMSREAHVRFYEALGVRFPRSTPPYVRMHKGWMYLCAVVDWHSRKVLAWRLSNTIDVEFCVAAVQEAIAQFGTPAIFNTDQGCQFSSEAFTSMLKRHGIVQYMTFYNSQRPPQAHNRATPDEPYLTALPFAQMQAV